MAEEQKIGMGHVSGMARLGLKELTQALPAFPDATVRPVEEPGVFGNTTPQLVTQELTGQGIDARLDAINAQQPPSQGPSQGPDIER